jgi:hypothetical protein
MQFPNDLKRIKHLGFWQGRGIGASYRSSADSPTAVGKGAESPQR